MAVETKTCVGCQDTEETARLERCAICARYFCADCAHRAYSRRFCSTDCARAFFFSGDEDEDEKDLQADD